MPCTVMAILIHMVPSPITAKCGSSGANSRIVIFSKTQLFIMVVSHRTTIFYKNVYHICHFPSVLDHPQ